MFKSNPYKWRYYEPEIILLCGRWYLSYPLSYRQVAQMVNERGLDVHHTTIFRWVEQYAPELAKRCRPHLRPTTDSWRVDETYIKIKGKDRLLVPRRRFTWEDSRLFGDGSSGCTLLLNGFSAKL